MNGSPNFFVAKNMIQSTIRRGFPVMDSPIQIAKATAFPMAGLASEFGSEAVNDGSTAPQTLSWMVLGKL